MINSIYFDIQLGASGDMILGALLDLGLDLNELIKGLKLLHLKNWSITPEKIMRSNINGTVANVKCKKEHSHRHLSDIKKIINDSSLLEEIKTNIITIFARLATAEAKIHGKDINDVHFHEVGAIDSIIDISAFCIAMQLLRIDKIFFNEFYLGSGNIDSDHGNIPVPVPAVVELTSGYKINLTDKKGELVTPTAAAILTALGEQKNTGNFTLLKSGTGFGTRDYGFLSMTRAFLVNPTESNNNNITDEINESNDLYQIECNIDDLNPQLYPIITELLMESGALDVYLSSIIMKKGRPGILLTVIAESEKLKELKEIIYSNSSTLGMRIFKVYREKLARSFKTIKLYGEDIRIKIGYLNDKIINIHPEFDDCKRVAEIIKKPVKAVIDEALIAYNKC